jgi:internalin A
VVVVVKIDKMGYAQIDSKLLHIWFIVIFLLSITSCIKPNISDNIDSTEINFADKNLEIAIREAIDKPIGAITSNDLVNLTDLNASNRNITSLEGIEHCSNLIKLHLINNNIHDLSPISTLADSDNLIELGLASNSIPDIRPLKELTSLQILTLTNNNITDIGILSNLTRIRHIGLIRNNISNIKALVDNPGINEGDEVYLSQNELSSIAINSQIPALESRGVKVFY